MIKVTYIIDGVNYDFIPAYLAKNGYYMPVNETNFTIEKTETVIDEDAEKINQALSKSIFTKLQIRRALRALNQETVLDALLSGNAVFAKDWNDATSIDLNDEMTAQVITSLNPDLINNINNIKLKIAGL